MSSLIYSRSIVANVVFTFLYSKTLLMYNQAPKITKTNDVAKIITIVIHIHEFVFLFGFVKIFWHIYY